jgi:hypothetical protein
MTMTNTTDTAAQRLRTALKAAGYNTKRASVRHDGSTLRVTLRDAGASSSAVHAIASSFVQVRRCEGDGDILCGGNTFVAVAYLDTLVDPVAAAVIERLRPAAIDTIIDLGDGFRAAKISRQRGATYMDEVRMWGPGFNHRNDITSGLGHAAKRIAAAMLDARARATSTTEARAA